MDDDLAGKDALGDGTQPPCLNCRDKGFLRKAYRTHAKHEQHGGVRRISNDQVSRSFARPRGIFDAFGCITVVDGLRSSTYLAAMIGPPLRSTEIKNKI